MKSPKRFWGLTGLIAVLALVLALSLPALPKPKAGAKRLHSVNRVAAVTVNLPGTNAVPSASVVK